MKKKQKKIIIIAVLVILSFILIRNLLFIGETPDYYRVFISSQTYDGNLGGMGGADAKCQQLANSAELGGTWKAYLGDDTKALQPQERIRHSSVPYQLLDGTVVANDWNDLTDGTLLTAINLNELSQFIDSTYTVWTGKFTDFAFENNLSLYTCEHWTSGSLIIPENESLTPPASLQQGMAGVVTDSIEYPERWQTGQLKLCDSLNRLYCIEQIPPCETHSTIDCYEGNMYWFNSCGEVEDLFKECEYGCGDGVCLGAPPSGGGGGGWIILEDFSKFYDVRLRVLKDRYYKGDTVEFEFIADYQGSSPPSKDVLLTYSLVSPLDEEIEINRQYVKHGNFSSEFSAVLPEDAMLGLWKVKLNWDSLDVYDTFEVVERSYLIYVLIAILLILIAFRKKILRVLSRLRRIKNEF